MKNLKMSTTLLFVLLTMLSFNSCSYFSSDTKSEEKSDVVTEPFHAEFIGDYTYVGPDTLASQKCTDSLYVWRAIVDCRGTSNITGDIRVHFDFCGDTNGNYGNTYAYMVDNKNDTLFVSCEGKVIEGRLDEHPAFVSSYWRDDFVITGGTGKYEGASGIGKTDDYNSLEDPNSHHHWSGIVTLNKESY
jgi:hypothetical protein